MIKVRVINTQANNDSWFLIYVNVDFVSYIEPLTTGDFAGHYLLAFDSRDFILHADDLNAIFD